MAEIEIAGIPAISAKPRIGTYACRELVIAYAAWISPVFHLKVIRHFLDTAVPAAATIEKTPMEGEIYQAVCAKTSGDGQARHWLWGRFNTHFGLASYKNLPTARFEEAKAFINSITIQPQQPGLSAPEHDTPEELITRWLEPNGYHFDSDFLARTVQTMTARLYNRLCYYQNLATGKPATVTWASPLQQTVNENPLASR